MDEDVRGWFNRQRKLIRPIYSRKGFLLNFDVEKKGRLETPRRP